MLNASFPLPGRLLLAASLALAAASTQAQSNEDGVKAAYLPKFARYVQWPAGAHPAPRAPFQLCVIGQDPFGRLLDRAAARELIDGRAIAVRRHPTIEGMTGCHLAYVRGATPEETARLLETLRSQPTLTVTDSRAGPQRGIIHFTLTRGRVRFFIDEAEAAARGLTISSRLLALAIGVRQRRT